jgi:hypothetical protein
MKPVTIYEADDGSRWGTEAEASKRDNKLAEDRGERIPVFNDDLGLCSCYAAVEIDGLILSRSDRRIYVEAMVEWLDWLSHEERDVFQTLFLAALKEMLGLAPKCETVDDVLGFAREMAAGLRQVLEAPEAVGRERLEWFRDFCLAASESASTERYYGRDGCWGRWRGRDRYSE